MIVEYCGELIRNCVTDRREADYEGRGIGSCYMFRLDRQHVVDATLNGSMARFMNHCCVPNAYAKTIEVLPPDGKKVNKIIIFAKKEIKAGEEVVYDYQFAVEDGSLKCTCGHPQCIGAMN
jgi:[histone H3]-lysine4 N-trimethyltransferase SETD1